VQPLSNQAHQRGLQEPHYYVEPFDLVEFGKMGVFLDAEELRDLPVADGYSGIQRKDSRKPVDPQEGEDPEQDIEVFRK
jgi:hypothetical protein